MLALEPFVDVWRVELPNGGGPYQSYLGRDSRWSDRAGEHGWRTVHPGPHDDGIPDVVIDSEKGHYGFESLTTLEAWFAAPDRRLLALDHFDVVHFRAPRASTHRGRRQLVFLRELSVEVSRHPIA